MGAILCVVLLVHGCYACPLCPSLAKQHVFGLFVSSQFFLGSPLSPPPYVRYVFVLVSLIFFLQTLLTYSSVSQLMCCSDHLFSRTCCHLLIFLQCSFVIDPNILITEITIAFFLLLILDKGFDPYFLIPFPISPSEFSRSSLIQNPNKKN